MKVSLQQVNWFDERDLESILWDFGTLAKLYTEITRKEFSYNLFIKNLGSYVTNLRKLDELIFNSIKGREKPNNIIRSLVKIMKNKYVRGIIFYEISSEFLEAMILYAKETVYERYKDVDRKLFNKLQSKAHNVLQVFKNKFGISFSKELEPRVIVNPRLLEEKFNGKSFTYVAIATISPKVVDSERVIITISHEIAHIIYRFMELIREKTKKSKDGFIYDIFKRGYYEEGYCEFIGFLTYTSIKHSFKSPMSLIRITLDELKKEIQRFSKTNSYLWKYKISAYILGVFVQFLLEEGYSFSDAIIGPAIVNKEIKFNIEQLISLAELKTLIKSIYSDKFKRILKFKNFD